MRWFNLFTWKPLALLLLLTACSSTGISWIYSYSLVKDKAENDLSQRLAYLEFQFDRALLIMRKFSQIEVKTCSAEELSDFKHFQLKNSGSGFIISHPDTFPKYKYCSSLGLLTIGEQKTSSHQLIKFEDNHEQLGMGEFKYKLEGVSHTGLFLGTKLNGRTDAMKIDDSKFFFKNFCNECRYMYGELFNGYPIIELGSDFSSPLLSIEIRSERYPLSILVKLDYNYTLIKSIGSLWWAGMVALAFWLAIFFAVLSYRQKQNSLLNRLQNALQSGELISFYQPIINVDSGEMYGAEALIRWVKKDGSIISPGYFIDELESSSLITPVTLCLIRQVLDNLSGILNQDPELKISVNIVPEHLEHPHLLDALESMAAQGEQVQSLSLEITERQPIYDIASAKIQIARIKALGLTLKLDDAGTGYGGISYLQEFDFDYIKIDKMFVDTLHFDKASSALDAQILMAGHLNLPLIAEGVETKKQALELLQRGVHLQQGYLFAKPMPLDDFICFYQEATKPDNIVRKLRR